LEAKAQVTLSVNKDIHCVEATVPLNGMMIRAEEKSDDMYKSIDVVKEKLMRQIRKDKTKINRKSRKQDAKGPFMEDHFPSDSEPDMLELTDNIVRTKHFQFKPMDVEEAVLQINLLGHNFFLFFDAKQKK
jgi:putative sigma-54 modulation protein